MVFWSIFRGLWYRLGCNIHQNCPFDDIRFNFANYTMAEPGAVKWGSGLSFAACGTALRTTYTGTVLLTIFASILRTIPWRN